MKKDIRKINVYLIVALFFSITIGGLAQAPPPPPPPPSSGHGQTGPQSGSGSPIGDGMYLLIGLVGLYGVKKVYELRVVKNEE